MPSGWRSFSLSSLSVRLALLLTLAVLPVFALVIYDAAQQRADAVRESTEETGRIAAVTVANYQAVVENARIFLSSLTHNPTVIDREFPACRSLFLDMLPQYPLYNNISLIDSNGDMICNAAPEHIPDMNLGDRGYFQRVMTNKTMVAGEYIVSRGTNRAVIVFAYPLFGGSSDVTGMLTVAIDLDWLSTFLSSSQLPAEYSSAIIDRDGIVLASYPRDMFVAGSPLPNQQLRQALDRVRQNPTERVQTSDEQRLYTLAPLSSSTPAEAGYVLVGTSKSSIDAAVNQSLYIGLLAIVVVLALVALIAIVAGRWLMLRPVKRVVSAADRMASGDLSVRTGPSYDHGELGALQRAFDTMASAIEKRQTDIEQITNILRQSEERLRQFIDHSQDGVVLVDHAGVVIEWNHAQAENTGILSEQAIGRGIAEVQLSMTLPEERAAAEQRWGEQQLQGFLKGGVRPPPHFFFEHWIQRPNGDRRLLQIASFAVPSTAGHMFGSVVRDITELRKTEDALRESEKKYRRLVELADEGITVLDADHRIMFVNSWAVKFFGYPEEEIIGKTPMDFVVEEDVPRVAEDVRKRERTERDSLFRYRSKDGKIRYGRVSSTPLYDEQGTYIGAMGLISDFTERHEAEQQLREAKEYAELLIATANVMIIVLDRDTRVVDCNPAAEQLTGYSRAELVGNNWFDLGVPPEEREQARRWHVNALADPNQSMGFERPIQTKTGEIRDVAFRIAFWSHQGQVDNTVIFGMDVTERHRVENDLRATKEFLTNLVEHAPVAIYVVDQDGKYQMVNTAWEILSHHRREEAIGNDKYSIYDPTTAARLAETDRMVLTSGKIFEDEEYLMVNGQPRDVFSVKFPIFDEEERVESVAALILDVTARKQAERQLQRANRALKTISRCNEILVRATDEIQLLKSICSVIVDVGGYHTGWVGYADNDEDQSIRAVAWVGVDDSMLNAGDITWGNDARGNGPSGRAVKTRRPCVVKDILEEDLQNPRLRNAAVKSGFVSMISVPLLTSDSAIGVLTIVARETDAFGEAEVSLFQELADDLVFGISALRLRAEHEVAEEEIKKLNETLEKRVVERTAQLEAANRELEAFTYSVSHDLRAPLRAIDGFSRILEDEYTANLDSEAQRLLSITRKNAQHMGQLIDDLLALSRVSRTEVQKSRVDIASLANTVIDELREGDPTRSVTFTVHPLEIGWGDQTLLRQVLVNLISNAYKFTSKNDVALIEIGCYPEQDGCVYFVKDNGVGFDMRYAHKLFGVFQRLHSTDEFDGTGVGLAIVDRIVRRHGGRVWAEAKRGEGATFSFTLPRKDDR